MTDQVIRVEMPRELDHHIEALRAAFDGLAQILASSLPGFERHLSSIENSLPAHFQNLREGLTEELAALLDQQVKATVATRLAAILASQEKIRALDALRSRRAGQVDEDLGTIGTRYQGLLQEVVQDCERQIRQLDSHAFELLEAVYPRHVEARFSHESTPTMEFLAAHAGRTERVRTEALLEAYQEASEAVARLGEAMAAALESVERQLVPCAPGWYEAPILASEDVDEATGERSVSLHLDAAGQAPKALPEPLAGPLAEKARRCFARGARRPLTPTERRGIARLLIQRHELPVDVVDTLMSDELELLEPVEGS